VDLTVPFRGSVALASGALTRGTLFGPGFVRLFPDVHVAATATIDLALRSRGAAVLVAGGVLSGYSAAELLGASCGPADAPAEVTPLSRARRRAVAGLVVHRERLWEDEVVLLDDIAVTSAARTAFDLVRRSDLTEGVVAADALAHHHRVSAADLRALRCRLLGLRGTRKLEPVLALMDRRAESPMESRIRVVLHDGGLPRPCVQHRVTIGGRDFRLDLAYPAALLAVEHDGRDHLTAERALRDLEREALLTSAGWKVLRFRTATVLRCPDEVAARTRAELARRSP
jgi:very-short-patch-repair endonuclease